MSRKKGLFGHLAWNGIKSNYKLYVPYILAAAGMTAMYYIILSLSMLETIGNMKGGSTAQISLSLGVIVISVFAVIFMFYTNSFLIRTRTREFGLYNILGMSRGHIARIVAIETVIAAAMSIVGGLFIGILFEKFAELLLCKLIKIETDYSWSIHPSACFITAATFFAIFGLVMVRSIIRIFKLKAIDLLKAENYGEKPPRAKWVLTVLGALILGTAYYIAVAIAGPVQAVTLFFFAVILVIIATYMLFISGSVSLCRGLQKNKKYYYKQNHFVSLSSMVYRMKRNGAGLASICILSTMVLVMISSTSCLYFGKEASLARTYPNNIMFDLKVYTEAEQKYTASEMEEVKEEIFGSIRQCVTGKGTELSNPCEFTYKSVSGVVKDGRLNESEYSNENLLGKNSQNWNIYFVTTKDFNRHFGTDHVLRDDEALCCEYGEKYLPDSLTLSSGDTYKIVDRKKDIYLLSEAYTSIDPCCMFVMNELPEIEGGLLSHWYYGFDVDVKGTEQIDLYNECIETFHECRERIRDYEDIVFSSSSFCREDEKAEFVGLFGGLFFLGIMLSLVFTCALVLIIYYKQISEGYEDRSRYEIMRKVGMTSEDIKKNVNSQMGSVFYMPFAAAVIHLSFAFPMIYSMLTLFSVTEVSSLLLTAVISVVIFGAIYTIVYKITSNSYYKIVR